MRGDLKADPRYIIEAHRRTYVDARTGKVRLQDHLLFEGLPLAVLVGCLAGDVRLNVPTSAGLLTVSGLLSAFLFGAMLSVYERAGEWSDSSPAPGRDTSEYAENLEELAANAGYASLVAIAAAIAFVIASATGGWALRASSAIGLALGCHLALVLLMVMSRLLLLTRGRLDRARAGDAQPERVVPHRRAS